MRWRWDEQEEEAEVSREVAIETEPLGRGAGGSRRLGKPPGPRAGAEAAALPPLRVLPGAGKDGLG